MLIRRPTLWVIAAAILWPLGMPFAQAEDAATAPATMPATQPDAAAGLLPMPDYTADFWHLGFLTGDWGGARTDLANQGIQFDVNFTQTVQSVLDGGTGTGTRYDGHLSYLLNLDLMRMGLLPGALLTIRAESRYGESVNGTTGAVLPANTEAFFPLTKDLDEQVGIAVTTLRYTQFLSEQFAFFVGKMDTLDGDPNEFASGRGVSQFMNANFIFNSALALRLPYSTLGTGVVVMPNKYVTINGAVVNTVDASTNSGLHGFGGGTTATLEADFQYRIGDLPGGMNVGGIYSFDQDFAHLNSQLIFQPGQGLSVPKRDDTWAAYWSAWQYIFVTDPDDKPVNLANGKPDHQGLGLFARVGFADRETNPVEWAASVGIGARGIIPSRGNDTLGLGYYYSHIQKARLISALGVDDHAQGMEAFYNIELTPAAQLTFDVQVLDSAFDGVDPAVVVGARLNLKF